MLNFQVVFVPFVCRGRLRRFSHRAAERANLYQVG